MIDPKHGTPSFPSLSQIGGLMWGSVEDSVELLSQPQRKSDIVADSA